MLGKALQATKSQVKKIFSIDYVVFFKKLRPHVDEFKTTYGLKFISE